MNLTDAVVKASGALGWWRTGGFEISREWLRKTDGGGGASSCTNSSARVRQSERTLLFCLAPISSVKVRYPAIQTSSSICPSTKDGSF
ncbi:hypothetical protein AOLI_G00148120 [Acnodon oligacanthus]